MPEHRLNNAPFDHYAILGVPVKATLTQIDMAFINRTRGASARIIKNLAYSYEILKDPAKRHAFDVERASWASDADVIDNADAMIVFEHFPRRVQDQLMTDAGLLRLGQACDDARRGAPDTKQLNDLQYRFLNAKNPTRKLYDSYVAVLASEELYLRRRYVAHLEHLGLGFKLGDPDDEQGYSHQYLDEVEKALIKSVEHQVRDNAEEVGDDEQSERILTADLVDRFIQPFRSWRRAIESILEQKKAIHEQRLDVLRGTYWRLATSKPGASRLAVRTGVDGGVEWKFFLRYDTSYREIENPHRDAVTKDDIAQLVREGFDVMKIKPEPLIPYEQQVDLCIRKHFQDVLISELESMFNEGPGLA